MLKELLPSVKTHFEDRLSNPILGAFSFSWFIINWKIVLILLFSTKNIEEKISFVETNYMSINKLLIYPTIFVLIYLLLIPWMLLIFQLIQEYANRKRKISKINSDTINIENRQKLLKAECNYNEIQFKHELYKEFERKRRDFELEMEKAPHTMQMEKDKKQIEMEYNEQTAQHEHANKMRELEYEERQRREALDHELQTKRQEVELQMEKSRHESEMKYRAEHGQM